MKELTGGDKIQARALYHDPIEFKPQFKMVLCRNDKPELPPHDEGTWRRIRNTEFISKFRHNPNPNNPLEFKIDTQISENFDEWKESFLGVLVHYFKEYKKVGCVAPDEIIEYTQSYRATNEHFKDFVNNKIEEDENENHLSIDVIYVAYKAWYNENHADNKDMKKRKELQKYLDDKFNKNWKVNNSKDIGYSGIKLRRTNINFDTSSCDIEEDELDS